MSPVPATVDAPASPAEVARRFVEARRAARALPGFPGPVPDRLEGGYAVQDAAIPLWPAPVAGWKLGRIAPPRDAELGAGRVSGPVFADQVWRAPAGGALLEVPCIGGGFGAVEAEYVLRVRRAPPPGRADLSIEEAAELADAMFVGVEFAGSPLATINDLGPTVVASDFGNNAGLVLGPEVAGWRDRPLATLACETWVDGACVGRGGAEQVPGGPVAALRDLVAILAGRGRTLAVGDLVTTGAATGVHNVRAGQEAECRFGRDGAIRLRIVPAVPR